MTELEEVAEIIAVGADEHHWPYKLFGEEIIIT
jgi:hypothetical protein